LRKKQIDKIIYLKKKNHNNFENEKYEVNENDFDIPANIKLNNENYLEKVN
jgi:hypothetical protein